MVAIAGELYVVHGDLSVLRSPPWGDAIGSGHDAARGSLHTTKSGEVEGMAPATRCFCALAAAAAVTAHVRGPFDILRLGGGGEVAAPEA